MARPLIADERTPVPGPARHLAGANRSRISAVLEGPEEGARKGGCGGVGVEGEGGGVDGLVRGDADGSVVAGAEAGGAAVAELAGTNDADEAGWSGRLSRSSWNLRWRSPA